LSSLFYFLAVKPAGWQQDALLAARPSGWQQDALLAARPSGWQQETQNTTAPGSFLFANHCVSTSMMS